MFFNSNLIALRNKVVKSRSSKYVFSDVKKYFWLMPFNGLSRNKNV